MQLPVTITDKAVYEIKKIHVLKGITSDMALRIGIKGSGCSGNAFMLGFDKKREKDDEFIFDGIKILVERKHFMYIAGMKIDFIDDNTQRGFTFVDK